MRTYEYRMRPTKAQEQTLLNTLIASRKMYNACLEELITHYKETGKYLHLYEQDKRHGKEAHPDLPAVVVDTTLKRLHRSFMVRNHCLAFAISDASWGTLREMLENKAENAGRQLIAIPPHFTSQKC